MTHPDYNSPAALKTFMEEQGMAMQKKFGQNFMINPQARTTILKDLALDNSSRVWEVGPGLGCMTEEILSSGANLTCFEIDRGFIGLLHQFFESQEKEGRFAIVEGDCLKNWYKEFLRVQEALGESVKAQEKKFIRTPIKLFGNLPYNIAATFIADTVTKGIVFDRCVFTVQKEVTERICAKPSTENYSAFSVLCQWAYDVKPGMVLGAGNFWPKPNVASQSVILLPKENPLACKDPAFLVKLVHGLFSSRRKTINNNIKGLLPKEINPADVFEKCGISPSERAENLSIQKFVELADCCTDFIAGVTR